MLAKKLYMTAAAIGLLSAALCTPALAGPRSYADIAHQPIPSGFNGAVQNQNRSLIVPYGKSATVDLPRSIMNVIVSNPDIVGASAHTQTRILITGKQPGQTNVFIYGQNGETLMTLDIRVERDMAGLRRLIAQHAPGNEIEVQAFNNNILLSGSVADASTSAKIVNLATLWLGEAAGDGSGAITNLMSMRGNDQVQLKVRIVEMQRSVTKQMGIDFNAVGQIGGANIGLISNTPVGASNGFSGSLDWTNAAGGALKTLSAGLNALERVGLVRTLAEPVLTAVSGETANFLAGGEFPLLTNVFVDDNGQIQREFEYKPFGVSLGFTPVVLSEGRISLNISTEVSEPTTQGAFETNGSDVLGLRVRRANSVVELPAGSSMVLAGLIREETRQSTTGTPGLKDIPGLGSLFRNRDDETTETELVIIVTPYLVNGTHPDKLQTPLDGFVASDDSSSLYLGRLNKVYGKNGFSKTAGASNRPFGHVVD